MDPKPTYEIAHEFSPFFRLYKDGRIERLQDSEPVPPTTDPQTGVISKDIVISAEYGLSARIFLPRVSSPTRKLPLLIYIHGGAFCIGSPFSPVYHGHVSSLVAEANVVALSVKYRLAPEHPLPVAYDDAWAAIQWAVSHVHGNGPESWLNDHADFQRVFLAGDSAGANIAYNMVDKSGSGNELEGSKIIGLAVVHPFFMHNQPDKLIEFLFPSSSGLQDPRLNPGVNPNLMGFGCSRVVVFVAENDWLKDRGWAFYEAMKKSKWHGVIDVVENNGKGHVFHLFNPKSDDALGLVERVASFINQA